MNQPSIATYFASRKRAAVDELHVAKAKKVLLLDDEEESKNIKLHTPREIRNKVIKNNNNSEMVNNKSRSADTDLKNQAQRAGIVTKLTFDNVPPTVKKKAVKSASKIKGTTNQRSIKDVFAMLSQQEAKKDTFESPKNEKVVVKDTQKEILPITNSLSTNVGDSLSYDELKEKFLKSSKLAELKSSISKLSNSLSKLDEAKETKQLSPKLKNFKTIQLEIPTSPQKLSSPTKLYLSPKKEITSPYKNNQTPKKETAFTKQIPAYQKYRLLSSPEKGSFVLPYKYNFLVETFRSVDTVCSMMFNRQETITFAKLKPAVEEIMRKTFTEKHLAQIKALFPNAFKIVQEKLKLFGTKTEKYELVITPIVDEVETITSKSQHPVMTPSSLLERRRKFYNILVEKVKNYHEEFLLSLDPPLQVDKHKIVRWHPEFNIDGLPDIEEFPLPRPPNDEKITSGKEMLERAHAIFSCNVRMEKALEKIRNASHESTGKESSNNEPKEKTVTLLKGIPKALLEKVREKQAARAAKNMTQSARLEKQYLCYSQLPEIARVTRNVFVTEKKSVLPSEIVIEKISNSYRSNLSPSDIQERLEILCRVLPDWLSFCVVRRNTFLRISKDGDMSKVMEVLHNLVKENC